MLFRRILRFFSHIFNLNLLPLNGTRFLRSLTSHIDFCVLDLKVLYLLCELLLLKVIICVSTFGWTNKLLNLITIIPLLSLDRLLLN